MFLRIVWSSPLSFSLVLLLSVWLHLLHTNPLPVLTGAGLFLVSAMMHWLSLCVVVQIPLQENHIDLSNLPAVPPEFKWLDPHPVQLVLARNRGLVTSEVAVGGQTSK